jgi:ribose-phosphate pyrophosphokinase
MSTETGTTELVLPGLEVGPMSLRPEPATEHWIERGPHKRLMLFAGRSNPDLAAEIAARLGIQLGEITLKTFANGETYCRYEESIRGADLFLIQTGSDPVDRNLMELLIMIQAAKLASAKRITVVVPWFPYSRQDKKSAPREPITGRLVADFLQTAGADRVLTMDLHAGQIQGFFNIPVDHMTALPLFAQHFRDLGLTGDHVVSVAPDAGRAKMGVKFAQMIESDFAIMHKTRPAHDVASVTEVTGHVRGKVALVGDDVIMTGGTLISGARALREAGATGVYVFATHGIFAKNALERFSQAHELDGIIVTDTVPVDQLRKPDKLTVLTVSGLLAETILNVFGDESVSAIFAGENQLF